MKSKKEIAKLRETIQFELGIDLEKYQDEEVAENLLDLLLFPKYILKWLARPVIICLLLFVIGFFVIDLVHIEYILYGTIGLLLFLLLGVFLGAVNLSRKLNSDVSSISEYSLGLLKNSVLDIDDLGGKVNKSNVKDVLSLLFKGVIFLVTIPMVNKAIEKKLPTGKPLVKRLVNGSLIALTSRIKFDPDKIDENAIKIDGDSKFISKYVAAIDRTKGGVTGVLGTVTKLVSLPFRLGTYVIGFFLLIFLFLLW